jgi:hypothetical protein
VGKGGTGRNREVRAETETEVRRERGKMSLGVKVASERVASEVRGEKGVLIDDVEKQRLDEAKAPCLNQRRQTRISTRYT